MSTRVRCHLLGEMRRAKNRDAPDLGTVEELAGDEQRLDGLADADVVGDEEADRVLAEGEEQRKQLVGPRLDGDPAEGQRNGPDTERRPRRKRRRGRRRQETSLPRSAAGSGGANCAAVTVSKGVPSEPGPT